MRKRSAPRPTGLQGLSPVWGGATRQASVRAGLEALRAVGPDFVLIHDAARPFLTGALITRAIDAAAEHRAAVPAVAVADTVKKVDERETVIETLDRSRLRLVQTPQAFAFDLIIEAHARAATAGRDDFTDDAALAEWAGHRVTVFPGETTNVKLTTNDDFIRAEAIRMAAFADVRTGNGFDVHAFGDGDHVMLGGVRIPHARGLPDIPTPTSFFMRWSMLFSARSPMAILDRTFPRATRNGVGHRPIDFSRSPANACARVRA